MHRFLRYLRIVFSAFCGLACVLLIALWVRSYWQTEFVERIVSVNPWYSTGVQERIVNGPGNLEFSRKSVANDLTINYTPPGWKYRSYDGVANHSKRPAWKTRFGSQSVVSFPHYFAVLLVGVVGVGPWIWRLRWRFSTRTLLIATTLFALVLGLAVYVARSGQ